MSYENADLCKPCPVYKQCIDALDSLNQTEDETIMNLMTTAIEDEAVKWAASGAELVMPNTDGEYEVVEFTPELARKIAAANLKGVQLAKTNLVESLNKTTEKCIGALICRTIENGVEYEIIVCRTQRDEIDGSDDDEYSVEQDDVADDDSEQTQYALIRRIVSDKTEKAPEEHPIHDLDD